MGGIFPFGQQVLSLPLACGENIPACLRFALRGLHAYDLIVRKKRRDDKDAEINNKINKVSFMCNHKNISTTAYIKEPEGLISRRRLARDLIEEVPVFSI